MEVTQDHIDLADYQQLIAATESTTRNALICADLGPEIGYHAVAQIGVDKDQPPLHHRGRVLLGENGSIDHLLSRHDEGWTFRRTPMTEQFVLADKKAEMAAGTMLIGVLKPDGRLRFFSSDTGPSAEPGDTLLTYGPPER
jgi:hypothetical protein